MPPNNSPDPFAVLVVDDNVNLSASLKTLLEMSQFRVDVAPTAACARGLLSANSYGLILLDRSLPDGDGLELIEEFPDLMPRCVMMSADAELLAASRETLPVPLLAKPFSVGDLFERLGVEARPAGRDDGGAGDEAADGEPDPFPGWVGTSAALARSRQQIRAVAPLPTTVFVLGESGTGKELAAEAIHRLSGRTGPFLTINCGAIPSTLIANELFGHERGSYTGASRSRPGLFERAHGGTVFLDEITELPIEHQPHLLRVLEQQAVTRIGGAAPIPIDVRVVAASNRVTQQLVRDSLLREDLFYRLMVFPIVLPPLRERAEDIPLLVQSFLDDWNRELGSSLTCSAEVLDSLMRHHWPGNVRELKHTVQRLAILSEHEITMPPSFLEEHANKPAKAQLPVGTSIRELERRLILATLEHFDGDRAMASSTLGISEKTLYNRLKAYSQELPGSPA